MPDYPGTWITITAQAEGSDHDGFRVAHYWDGRTFASKPEAVSNGFEARGSDDFNVGYVKGGRLESLWWMENRLAEDEPTLAGIAREIGIVASAPPPERAARRLPPPRRAAPPALPASPGGRGPEAPEAPPEGKAPGYSGQEWRDKVKAATSGLHDEQRRGKGRYRKKGTVRPVPGMNRRMPPQPPGSAP